MEDNRIIECIERADYLLSNISLSLRRHISVTHHVKIQRIEKLVCHLRSKFCNKQQYFVRFCGPLFCPVKVF